MIANNFLRSAFGLAALLSFMSIPAHAIVELRLHGGINRVAPGDINDLNIDDLKFSQMTGYGADLLLQFTPVIGLGLRYENASEKKSADVANVKKSTLLEANRLAVLMDYRFIDTGLYFGPIGSFGVTNTLKYTYTTGSTVTEYKAGSVMSYTAGIELGLKISEILLGIEGGYASTVGTDLKDGDDNILKNSGNNVKADLTGMYGKVIMGFTF